MLQPQGTFSEIRSTRYMKKNFLLLILAFFSSGLIAQLAIKNIAVRKPLVPNTYNLIYTGAIQQFIVPNRVTSIQINAIGPTPIATDLIKAIPSSKIEELLSKQSIKRLGTYDDVANVINFFISPDSNMITGQIIYLGGL